jgi:hypothetical protein
MSLQQVDIDMHLKANVTKNDKKKDKGYVGLKLAGAEIRNRELAAGE